MGGFVNVGGGQNRFDLFFEVIFGYELEIGVGGDDEAIGDRDADFVHFSQVGALAANYRDVIVVNFFKPENIFFAYCHPLLGKFLTSWVSSGR